jgi:NADPH:quinone reductase-like Zn-dependent oxidoreductase
MKAVQFARYGKAAEVCDVVDMPEPPAPGAGEVSVELEYAPINPADLVYVEGRYGVRPPALPGFAGGEGVARVTALGEGVSHLQPGDRILLLLGGEVGIWRTRLNLKARTLFPLPPSIDPKQAAMLGANPPTALWMLTEFVKLEPGDWVIQNAANSAVGQLLIKLCKLQGWRTINLVRRAELIEPLKQIGADVVLVDGPDVSKQAREAAGGKGAHLGIDAIAGDATRRLSRAVRNGGTVVNYGGLSGQACQMEPGELIFRDVSLEGFWLPRTLAQTAPERVRELYMKLAGQVADGTLAVEIEKIYPLAEARAALAHAAQEGRRGKILLAG